jgi:hypothetical protein
MLARPNRPNLPALRLTPRDINIVRTVYAFRAMTARQIHDLFFDTGPDTTAHTISSRCQYRLKLLFQHGFLFRDAPPAKHTEGRKPLIYFLDRAAKSLLADSLHRPAQEIDWHPRHNNVSWPFLDHLLETNKIRVAFTLACRRQGYTLHTWYDEHRLRSQEMKDYVTVPNRRGRIAVVPDSYIYLTDRQYGYHHFLEVDLATETVGMAAGSANRKTFARKIQAYLAYYRSGQYTRRYGTQAMRVLVVTTGRKRLQNLRTVTARVGGGSQFWFATLDQIDPETVLHGPIWQVAGAEGERSLLWPHPSSEGQRAASSQQAAPMQPPLITLERAQSAAKPAYAPAHAGTQ